jgi:hypothetical protein
LEGREYIKRAAMTGRNVMKYLVKWRERWGYRNARESKSKYKYYASRGTGKKYRESREGIAM